MTATPTNSTILIPQLETSPRANLPLRRWPTTRRASGRACSTSPAPPSAQAPAPEQQVPSAHQPSEYFTDAQREILFELAEAWNDKRTTLSEAAHASVKLANDAQSDGIFRYILFCKPQRSTKRPRRVDTVLRKWDPDRSVSLADKQASLLEPAFLLQSLLRKTTKVGPLTHDLFATIFIAYVPAKNWNMHEWSALEAAALYYFKRISAGEVWERWTDAAEGLGVEVVFGDNLSMQKALALVCSAQRRDGLSFQEFLEAADAEEEKHACFVYDFEQAAQQEAARLREAILAQGDPEKLGTWIKTIRQLGGTVFKLNEDKKDVVGDAFMAPTSKGPRVYYSPFGGRAKALSSLRSMLSILGCSNLENPQFLTHGLARRVEDILIASLAPELDVIITPTSS